MARTTGYAGRVKGAEFFGPRSRTQAGLGTSAFPGGGNIYSNQSVAGFGNLSDTTEDTLDSFTLPGGTLDNPGAQVFIYAHGTYANNTNNKTVKLYFGTQAISTGVQTMSNLAWVVEAVVQKTAANAQVISGQYMAGATHGGATYNSGAENDTGGIVLKVTGQSGSVASGNMLLKGWFVQVLNAP